MEIDRNKFKVWDKKNFSVIFSMINPGLAINELVLGQRIAKVILIDQTSDKPLMERTYVPCPHCGTHHAGVTWSLKNKTALKNWFGLYCPNCEGLIPCHRNWTSFLILALTYPLWFWWINRWKESWLRKQPERYSNLNLQPVEHKKVNWIKMGLLFGAAMYILSSLSMILTSGSEYILTAILVNIPIWTIGGIGFGYLMKWQMGKRVKNANNTNT